MTTLVTRDDYFEASLTILSTQGSGGLKLAPLCVALGVTSGSFYHYFESWREFKTAFLEFWVYERTTQLVEATETEAEPKRKLEMLLEFSAALPHAAEAAIRAWGHRDDEVRAVQATVDQQRLEVVVSAMTPLFNDEKDAIRFARMGLFILAGFQQVQPAQPVEALTWSLQHLIADILQSTPF